ncbi:3',5'-cyclic-nucleotide phosphodiesterase [Massospora cicadina]|nr:3',5'-cyclic-nucleotide phosphodiesterase [Massospora cicadina]
MGCIKGLSKLRATCPLILRMFQLPIASLFVVQADLRKATFDAKGYFGSSAARCLGPGVVDAMLNTVPEVRIFPCGVSAVLEIRGATIILLDMDEAKSQCQRCRPRACLRGSSLLPRLVARGCDVVPIGSSLFDARLPLVMATRWSESAVRSSLDLGAVDYITKPLSPAVAQFLWLNVFRNRLAGDPALRGRLPSFRLAPMLKPELAWDAHVEAAIVNHFSPPFSGGEPERRFSVLPARGHPLLRAVRRRRFNPYQFQDSDLLICCHLILSDVCAAIGVAVDADRLQRFILAVQASYLNNPYHNFQHAVDVLQATYLYLLAMGLRSGLTQLTPAHILALCIAALGHDLGHPGFNNAFLVKRGAPLASLYGNVAVLENYHAMALITLIHRCDCLFVAGVFADHGQFHRLLAEIILATDMSAHFAHVQRIAELCTRASAPGFGFAGSDSLVVLSTLIKCADISNVVRPFEIAKVWTRCLNAEMLSQCDRELALGLEPSVPRDQLVADVGHSQVAFIRGMALPLFEATVALIPGLAGFLRQLRANLALWQHPGRRPTPLAPKSAPPPLESPAPSREPSARLSPRLALYIAIAPWGPRAQYPVRPTLPPSLTFDRSLLGAPPVSWGLRWFYGLGFRYRMFLGLGMRHTHALAWCSDEPSKLNFVPEGLGGVGPPPNRVFNFCVSSKGRIRYKIESSNPSLNGVKRPFRTRPVYHPRPVYHLIFVFPPKGRIRYKIESSNPSLNGVKRPFRTRPVYHPRPVYHLIFVFPPKGRIRYKIESSNPSLNGVKRPFRTRPVYHPDLPATPITISEGVVRAGGYPFYARFRYPPLPFQFWGGRNPGYPSIGAGWWFASPYAMARLTVVTVGLLGYPAAPKFRGPSLASQPKGSREVGWRYPSLEVLELRGYGRSAAPAYTYSWG